MCDEWEEDETPYNPSQESNKSFTSPRSDRKRAYDSRGNYDRHRDNSRDNRDYNRRNYDDRRDRNREFSRRDDNQSDYGPKEEFMINSVDVSVINF